MQQEEHLTKNQIATRKVLDWMADNYPLVIKEATDNLIGRHSLDDCIAVLEKIGNGVGQQLIFQLINEYAMLDFVNKNLNETLLTIFLKTNSDFIDEVEKQSLEAKLFSRKTLYEVQGIKKDKGLLLKDCLSRETLWVKEHSGTHSMNKWDLIFARVETFSEQERLLTGIIISFPREANEYLDDLKNKYDQNKKIIGNIPDMELFNFRLLLTPLIFQSFIDFYLKNNQKKLVTKDGDELVFVTQKAAISDREKLLAYFEKNKLLKLTWNDAKDKVYNWTDENNSIIASFYVKKHTITVEVNSEERGKKIEELFMKDLSKWTKNWRTERKTMNQATADHTNGHIKTIKIESQILPGSSAGMSKTEEKKLLARLMQGYYDQWIVSPLPFLHGLSPRQAMDNQVLRAKLIFTLKTMENNKSHQGHALPVDVERIKRQLGLKSSDFE